MTRAGTRGWWRKRTRGIGSRMGRRTGRYFWLNKVLATAPGRGREETGLCVVWVDLYSLRSEGLRPRTYLSHGQGREMGSASTMGTTLP